MQAQTVNTFEKLYDTYSPMIYGIALQIAPNQKQAEQILITTFTKAHQQNTIQQNQHSLCATLIQLTIQTAHEQLKPINNFKIKQFENTPLLHKLLCEQVTLEKHCHENKLTRIQAAKQIREEFNSIRNGMVNGHSERKSNYEPQNKPQQQTLLAEMMSFTDTKQLNDGS